LSRGIFVTGTDTGVGKTVAAVALIRGLARAGLRTVGMKPVAAGLPRGGGVHPDVAALAAAANVDAPLADRNPYALSEAAAPHLVAAREGVAIDLAAIAAAHARLCTLAEVVVVDFHAEVTSEKVAMGWYLDGRVAAVLGTHTHVPTADERVLPQGTALQTDVGMTGPYESIIGMRPEKVLERFLYNTPRPFEPAKRGVQLRGALVDADEESGKALAIRRLRVDVA